MVTAVRSSGSRQPSQKPSCNTPSSRTHRWSQRSSHKYNRTRKRGAGGGIVCVSFEQPKMHSVHPAEGSGGKRIVDIQGFTLMTGAMSVNAYFANKNLDRELPQPAPSKLDKPDDSA